MKFIALIFFVFSSIASAKSNETQQWTQLRHTQEGPNEPEVFQREYIVTSSELHSAVQTYGVYTCVALVIYDPQTKQGLLAHLDSGVDLNSLRFLARDFDLKRMKISILGGQPTDSFNLHQKIKNKIQELGGHVQLSLFNRAGSDMSLRLNLETGEVSFYAERLPSTPPDMALAKIQRLKYESRLYRHPESIGGGDLIDPITLPIESGFPLPY
ncbi:hypothetical protein [Pseudobdellovibrio exovorus]|uniref:Uncharacterized protein n=1 Tax=Pseudobdellovibrio exovorus JSS TaxID=1184267 RepID=M4VD59_9BACT|nr:hypothetical protein [Pseudobdellovibrio exovorus]AGH96425.1 hypothetical protein A11Q_2209 [Pseudobdellovibrio exovorus JSS]